MVLSHWAPLVHASSFSSKQVAPHPSPVFVEPSSQLSPVSTLAFPQTSVDSHDAGASVRSQTGAPTGQSPSPVHPAVHAPLGLQKGVPGSIAAHSRLLEQGLQEPDVPQTGALASSARHWPSVAQESHEPVGSQIGVSESMAAHWAPLVQASHAPEGLQIGMSASIPEHSALLEQASQMLVPVLQTGVAPEQSVSVKHPATQAPDASQKGVAGSIVAHWVSEAHGTQSSSTPSQMGVVSPQSESETHFVGTSMASMGTSAALTGVPSKQAQSLSIPDALDDEPNQIVSDPVAPLSLSTCIGSAMVRK